MEGRRQKPTPPGRARALVFPVEGQRPGITPGSEQTRAPCPRAPAQTSGYSTAPASRRQQSQRVWPVRVSTLYSLIRCASSQADPHRPNTKGAEMDGGVILEQKFGADLLDRRWSVVEYQSSKPMGGHWDRRRRATHDMPL